MHCSVGLSQGMDPVSEYQVALIQHPAITPGFPFLQEPISDLPRFILFFITYGLQLLLFLVSGFTDVAPETKEIGKKV